MGCVAFQDIPKLLALLIAVVLGTPMLGGQRLLSDRRASNYGQLLRRGLKVSDATASSTERRGASGL